MSANPPTSFMDSRMPDDTVGKLIETACQTVQLSIENAAESWERYLGSVDQIEEKNLALLMLCRHVMQMGSSILVLFQQRCMPAVWLILRSMLEAIFDLEYISEKGQDQDHRALCWLAGYYLQERAHYETMLPSESSSRSDYNDIISSRFRVEIIDEGKIKEKIRNINRVLSKGKFRDIADSWKTRRLNNWRQLCCGPSNVRKLAIYLHRYSEYYLIYCHSSAISHVSTMSHLISISGNSGIQWRDPQDVSDISVLSQLTKGLLLNCADIMRTQARDKG